MMTETSFQSQRRACGHLLIKDVYCWGQEFNRTSLKLTVTDLTPNINRRENKVYIYVHGKYSKIDSGNVFLKKWNKTIG